MIRKRFCLVAVLALLAGCGPLRDARDTARGVDDAVSLLQALDDRSAWEALRDGASALEALDHGYAAELQVQTSDGAPLAVEIQADADDEALITVSQPGAASTETYFVSAWRDIETLANVYRLAGDRYPCANTDADFLRGGLSGAFQHFAPGALGPELLAVRALEGDEVALVEREATRYALESRRAGAVQILRELENDDLAARVEAAGEYDLSGAITLDDETGALLAAESVTALPGGAGEVRLAFAVTQWNLAEDLAAPAEDLVTEPCR